MSSTNATTQKLRVAIVGAGASGLAAARVFSRNGIAPTILEQNNYSGGVWKYNEGDAGSPMYRGLRTNLPKEIMAFREFPFPTAGKRHCSTATSKESKQGDYDSGYEYDPSFVTHETVQQYLEDYQANFDLTQYIHYGSQVQKLEVLKDTKSGASPSTEVWPQIRLEWKQQHQQQQQNNSDDTLEKSTFKTGTFDAVLVCNGHYAKPAFTKIKGFDEYFQGTTIHSVSYDNPANFKGQRVLCVGGRASGSDLAREISEFAEHVYLSDSTCQHQAGETKGNVTVVPPTRGVKADGSISFEDCPTVNPTVDCIIFCTGYDYAFPFLEHHDDTTKSILQAVPGERRVMPLYEQLWHARYPTLAFLGVPHSVVPFPEVEFQAEAIHAQYTTRTVVSDSPLPVLDERLQIAEQDGQSGGAKENGRIQDTHYLGGTQWDYCRRLAKLAGVYNESVDEYIATNQAIYQHSWEGRKGAFAAGPDTYRDVDYRRNDSQRSFTVHSQPKI